MIKIFKCAIFVVIILVAVGCEMSDIAAPLDPSVPGRPTVPLKRRPIVPSTKLPRPRVAGEEFAAIEAEAYEAAEWEYYEEW